jgi:UDPglucose 6-dehydrogenase
MKLTSIGYGYVGGSVGEVLKQKYDLHIIDPSLGFTEEEYKFQVDGIILCLPAPTLEDGTVDYSLLEQYLIKIKEKNPTVPVLIKSTILPDFANKMLSLNENANFSPEYLTAVNAKEDFKNSKFMVFSGAHGQFWEDTFRKCLNVEKVVHCEPYQAAFMKHTINSFLATKVIWFNELYQLYSKYGDDYNVLKELVQMDDRLGKSHMSVPGPDGEFGFGGACFPKDTKAFSTFAKSEDSAMKLIEKSIIINQDIKTTK